MVQFSLRSKVTLSVTSCHNSNVNFRDQLPDEPLQEISDFTISLSVPVNICNNLMCATSSCLVPVCCDTVPVLFLAVCVCSVERTFSGSLSWPSILWETESSMRSSQRGELSLFSNFCLSWSRSLWFRVFCQLSGREKKIYWGFDDRRSNYFISLEVESQMYH